MPSSPTSRVTAARGMRSRASQRGWAAGLRSVARHSLGEPADGSKVITSSSRVWPAAMWSAMSLPVVGSQTLTDAAIPLSSLASSVACLRPGSSLSATTITCLPRSGDQSALCALPAPIARADRCSADGFDGQHVLFAFGDVHGFGVADAVGVK